MKKFFKVLGTALFGMHLWLPVAYSLIFLMIAAISGKIAVAWPYYFIGLAIAFAGSLLLVYFLKGKQVGKSKKAASTAEVAFASKGDNRATVKRSEYVLENDGRADMSEYVAAEQARYAGNMTAQPGGMNNGYDARGSYGAEPMPQPSQFNADYMTPQPQPPMNGYEGGYGSPQGYTRPTYDSQAAHDALYPSFSSSPSSQPSAPSQSAFSPYVQPQNAQTENSPRISDYEAGHRELETPKIFRMRANPNILVYEYSDRYEKFEQLPNGDRHRISVEYK